MTQNDSERSATDERIAENSVPATVAPATRKPEETEQGGLPPGQSDSRESPLDSVFYDPKPGPGVNSL